MNAADPTYPLYPIASFLAAAMLLLVLLTGLIRQNWNLGVALLCFWLCLNNLAGAVSAIIWSDNAEVKLLHYCDIVSHLYVITCVTKPMATLIITRRLHIIASLQSVDFPSKTARRRDLCIELILGLGVPLLVAGPLYYINQSNRFDVNEGFGCANSQRTSVLEILTIESWTLVPPLISMAFYYPRVVRTFYQQRRDINSFLSRNNSISYTNYLRILILASIDILLTLPTSIVTIVLRITSALEQGYLPFYWGWDALHADWTPASVSYAEIMAGKTSSIAQYYYSYWTAPILSFAIFGLFGLTPDARASYWRIICAVGSRSGWNPSRRTHDAHTSLGEIQFNSRPQDVSFGDSGLWSRPLSLANVYVPTLTETTERRLSGSAELESGSESLDDALGQYCSNIRNGEHLEPIIAGTTDAALKV